MDLAASIQAVTDETVLRLTRAIALRDRRERISAWREESRSTASPMGRSCARPFENTVGPACGRRRGRRRGVQRCWRITGTRGSRRHRRSRATAGPAGYLGPQLPAGYRGAPASGGSVVRGAERGAISSRRRPRRSPRGRPWGGSRGGWSSARGRWVPAEFPVMRGRPPMQSVLNLKVKYRGGGGGGGSTWRSGSELDAGQSIHAARRRCGYPPSAARRTPDEQALFGIEKLNVARFEAPACNPHRLLGANPDRPR